MWKNNILILCGGLLLSSFSLAQTCNSQIAETTPAYRFEIHGNGTVTDKQTGLMWKQCHEGQSGNDCATGDAISFPWDEALQTPETLNASGGYAGHTDWRLPNIKELLSIVEEACYGPAINLSVFPGLSGWKESKVWSGSPFSDYSGYPAGGVWRVYFNSGRTNGYGELPRPGPHSPSNSPVRLVRNGE